MSNEDEPKGKRLLIAAPVNTEPRLLELHLEALSFQERPDGIDEIDWLFIDDNDIEESSSVLRGFVSDDQIIPSSDIVPVKTRHRHQWDHVLTIEFTSRIGLMRNYLLDYARGQYDYLYMVDTDLLPQSDTLRILLEADKDMACAVFWTEWPKSQSAGGRSEPLPNAWESGNYSFVTLDAIRRHSSDPKLLAEIHEEFLNELRTGVDPIRVGCSGACSVFKMDRIPPLANYTAPRYFGELWGGDRWFGMRAEVMGVEIWVCPNTRVFHCYRPENLKQAESIVKCMQSRGFGTARTVTEQENEYAGAAAQPGTFSG